MNNNAHVFISYSRHNLEFAKRLFEELSKNQRDVWVDWDDIPRAADWLQEIYSGIDNADTFIFLVSEHSLVSEICNQELQYALQHNKRVIPLILQQVEDDIFKRVDTHWKSTTWYPIAQKNWNALKHLNWVFFDNPANYGDEFIALLKTIDQDLFHIKTHTRLLVRAREWRNNEKNPSSLLAGDDIVGAEHWLQTYANKDPLPTDLHRDYILNSRQIENEKIAHEARLQNQARQRLQILVASFVIIILAVVFGLLPITNTLLVNELGAETDERLAETAFSFMDLLDEDEALAIISARFVANLPSIGELVEANNGEICEETSDFHDELEAIRIELSLQELSFYHTSFLMGDSSNCYVGPEITHNDRVQLAREELILQVLETGDDASRSIIGSPESQIIGLVPVFSFDDRDEWGLRGVILAALHINDDYIQNIADILNVEAVITNIEQQVVATTLLEGPAFQDELQTYRRDYNFFDSLTPVYIDYLSVEGDTLRMISTRLTLSEEEQGFLFVARSFDAVISLQQQIASLFLVFSGVVMAVIVILIIALVGMPTLRNRTQRAS